MSAEGGISTTTSVGVPAGRDPLVPRPAGVGPYFSSEAAGRGPGDVEFRIGDYHHELGIDWRPAE
jgi:hypothetical protein